MQTKDLEALLKTASDELDTSREVIEHLVDQVQKLQHQVAARDVAVKLASLGQLPAADLADKVAELENKSADDVRLDEKVAEHLSGFRPSHGLQAGSEGRATSALSFLES